MKSKIIPVNLGFVKSFLIQGDKTIIVDAGVKGSEQKILAAMQTNGITPTDVSLILITHAHSDHFGGLKALKEAVHAPVAVHKAEAVYLAEGKSAPVHATGLMKALSKLFGMGKIDAVQPDVLIDNLLDLAPYGVDGKVICTPGHTDGSLTLITTDGDAITGDIIGGKGGHPAIPAICADREAMAGSYKIICEAGAQQVYTSHAGVYAAEEIAEIKF